MSITWSSSYMTHWFVCYHLISVSFCTDLVPGLDATFSAEYHVHLGCWHCAVALSVVLAYIVHTPFAAFGFRCHVVVVVGHAVHSMKPYNFFKGLVLLPCAGFLLALPRLFPITLDLFPVRTGSLGKYIGNERVPSTLAVTAQGQKLWPIQLS